MDFVILSQFHRLWVLYKRFGTLVSGCFCVTSFIDFTCKSPEVEPHYTNRDLQQINATKGLIRGLVIN